MTYAGWPESAATDDAFYLLRGRDGGVARTLLPVEDVGRRCTIVCERRAGPVPHLLAIINLTALAHGVLPLHASAFTYRGAGVLATGWAKGGKTETLLAFAGARRRYVGDEWIYLTPDGRMHGVPEPIRLWHWHVRQLPELRAGLPARHPGPARPRSRPWRRRRPRSGRRRCAGCPPRCCAARRPSSRRQAYVQVPPARLFGEDAIALHGRLDHVLFVASHDRDDVSDRADRRCGRRRPHARVAGGGTQPVPADVPAVPLPLPRPAVPRGRGRRRHERRLLDAVARRPARTPAPPSVPGRSGLAGRARRVSCLAR